MIEHIGDVCRVAVPMVLYFSIMWAGTLFMTRSSGVPYARAVTQVCALRPALTTATLRCLQ